MKILTAVLVMLLAACALDGGGNVEMYGEIKAGIESGHTKIR